MATSRSQRIGIWLIAITMFIGTIAGFIAMMVAPGNQARDDAELQAAQESYTKAYTEYQKKVSDQAAQLSKTYLAEFSSLQGRVKAFDVKSVDKLKAKDIKEGTGTAIKDETEFAAYYIGWNPKGEVFDQSLQGQALKAPFQIKGLKSTGVIEGWKKGLVGMKIGGIRQLTIPADQAYGKTGQGDKIPADTPLKFIVMAIELPAEIEEPAVPEVLKKQQQLYGGLGG